jgi:hypothetical protein
VVRYNSNNYNFHCSNIEKWEYEPILQWDQLSKKFPWGIFMLQGAGLAIADGFKVNSNKKVFHREYHYNFRHQIYRIQSLLFFNLLSEHLI